jgi:hypothetical protein
MNSVCPQLLLGFSPLPQVATLISSNFNALNLRFSTVDGGRLSPEVTNS